MSEQKRAFSTEALTLMSLVYRDLDDGDYRNAMFLAERLYAIDKKNEHYIFLFSKCLYHMLDYTACFSILRAVKSIPCQNLFAETCIKLGSDPKMESQKKRRLWNDGVAALHLALSSKEIPEKVYWGDELASTSVRHHLPSKASLCSLLADLYIKLNNTRAAAKYLWMCLQSNPYKVTAYNRLCDIAPDCVDFKTAQLPEHVFTPFQESKIDLRRNPHPYLLSDIIIPDPNASDIQFYKEIDPSSVRLNSHSLPAIRQNDTITVDQLRSFVTYQAKIIDNDEDYKRLTGDNKRSQLESIKNEAIILLNNKIKREKKLRAQSTKNGLPKGNNDESVIIQPADTPLDNSEDISQVHNSNSHIRVDPDAMERDPPPQLLSTSNDQSSNEDALKEEKSNSQMIDRDIISNYFIPQPNYLAAYFNQEANECIVQGMNKVMKLLRIMANGYLYQSFYYCEQTALELHQLDNSQYDTPSVLCMLGRVYYDTSDYETAHVLFRHAFKTSPWFCKEVPMYSTCLWYLKLSAELNILVYRMEHENYCHKYETYIAAGNLQKLYDSNDAIKWFIKAAQLDPSRYYAYILIGNERRDNGDDLGAKQYFANSMVANQRSYQAWHGMASCFNSMQQYDQARILFQEAYRLHPRHPVILLTMASVLYELREYDDAETFIRKSIANSDIFSSFLFKEKILTKSSEPTGILEGSSFIY